MLFVLYNLLYPLLALVFIARLVFSSRRDLLRTLPAELRERLGLYPPPDRDRPLLWFHAASMGEVRALPKLLDALRAAPSRPSVWITTSTAAGKRAAGDLAADAVRLAPLDLYPLTRRCLNRTRPKALLIAETELWPSLLRGAKHAGASLLIVNGRISEKSARRYRQAKSLFRLDLIDLACVQTEEDREHFISLGTDPAKTHVVGNLKHDFLPEELKPTDAVLDRLAAAGWGPADPIFIAGSTHPGEEDQILEAFLAARRGLPRLRLILAPRHVERSSEVEANLARRGLRDSLWSRQEKLSAPADVLLIDGTGVLLDFYRAADVVFVGGSLVDKGGHNIMEPAGLAKPTLFGPHIRAVASAAELLLKSGGGFQVKDAAEIQATLEALLAADPAEIGRRARQACRSLGGATARTLQLLEPFLR